MTICLEIHFFHSLVLIAIQIVHQQFKFELNQTRKFLVISYEKVSFIKKQTQKQKTTEF